MSTLANPLFASLITLAFFFLLLFLFNLFFNYQEFKKKILTSRFLQSRIKTPAKVIYQAPSSKIRKFYSQARISLSFYVFIILTLFLTSLITVLFFILFHSFLLALGALILIICSILLFLKTRIQKYQSKINLQIPEFLDSFSSALQAGYSLEQAFQFTSQTIQNPLKAEFQKVSRELKYHPRLIPLLVQLAKNLNNEDLSLAINSLAAQHQIGGNLPTFLKKISALARERIKLHRDLKTLTSQGRLSGIIVALLWPISIFFFSRFSPGYFDIMLTTPMGKALLFFAIILEILGFIWIWKLVNIKI